MSQEAENFIKDLVGVYALLNGKVCRVSLCHYSLGRGYRWVLADVDGEPVADIVANSVRSCHSESFEQASVYLNSVPPLFIRDSSGKITGVVGV